VLALDKRTGKTVWEKALPEPVPTKRFDGFKGQAPGVVGSFSTPLAIRWEGRDEVLLSLPEALVALAAADGSELWRAGGLNPLVYTSPFLAGDMVIAMGGFFGSSIAVRLGGSGDVTESRRVWQEERSRKNRLGSAVVKDGTIYLVNMDGFFECLDLRTGRQLWEERLNGPGAADASWSSVTLAGDRVYAVNRSGDTFVLRASRTFEVIAVNTVGEPSNSSLAMSDGELFLRTWKGLWCLSEKRRLAAR
ncbi:MAG: PQQ-binding-like beta-propeller repeat protein, partial [Limisphaerales bacterium]